MTRKTNHFPVFLNLRGAAVLVVGAGKVAERKIGKLLSHGARLTVVARNFSVPVRGMCA
jgi:uroporphyrin-III C-methyltransferase/precorrin-2 dehydrogenase/sirohydrochlorin ferrochelatase